MLGKVAVRMGFQIPGDSRRIAITVVGTTNLEDVLSQNRIIAEDHIVPFIIYGFRQDKRIAVYKTTLAWRPDF